MPFVDHNSSFLSNSSISFLVIVLPLQRQALRWASLYDAHPKASVPEYIRSADVWHASNCFFGSLFPRPVRRHSLSKQDLKSSSH